MTPYECFCQIYPLNDAGYEWSKKADLIKGGKIPSDVQNRFLKDFLSSMQTHGGRHPAEIIEDITNKVSVLKACCEQKAPLGELAMDKAREKVIEQVNLWQSNERANIYFMLIATCLAHDDMACMPEDEMDLPFGLTVQEAKEAGLPLNGLRLNDALNQPDLRALVERRASPEAGINEDFVFLADKLQFCLDCAKLNGTPIEPSKAYQMDNYFVFSGALTRPISGQYPASLAVHKTLVDYVINEVGQKEAKDLFWPNQDEKFSWLVQGPFNRYLEQAFSNTVASQKRPPNNPNQGHGR